MRTDPRERTIFDMLRVPPKAAERKHELAHMRRSRLPLVLLSLVLLAAACAPIPLWIYAPDMPDTKVIYSTCPFNSHVPIGVGLAAAGIEATVSLASHEGRPYVEARLDVPEGITVVLQDGAVKIETATPHSSSRAEIPVVSLIDRPIVNNVSEVLALQQRRMPIAAPLVGQRIAAGNSWFNRHFWLATYVDTAAAQDVWLDLPRFTVNGVPASFPRLHFHRQPVVAVALFNC